MIYLRKANERGHANHGWLDSWHTFSFANYYDPNFMGFSALRVINDDVIDAGQGFGTHPHKDMEILTYVLEGAVEHQDSMGNKEQVPAGEFQIMSAGTGVRHSEYNPSKTDRLRLYQIWIIPEETGITPRYEQRRFDAAQGKQLVLSPDARDGSLKVYQDAHKMRVSVTRRHYPTKRPALLRLLVLLGRHILNGDVRVLLDEVNGLVHGKVLLHFGLGHDAAHLLHFHLVGVGNALDFVLEVLLAGRDAFRCSHSLQRQTDLHLLLSLLLEAFAELGRVAAHILDVILQAQALLLQAVLEIAHHFVNAALEHNGRDIALQRRNDLLDHFFSYFNDSRSLILEL